MNNGMVEQLAGHFAERVRHEAGTDPRAQVERVYLIALGRPPTTGERKLGERALRQLAGEWAKQPGASADAAKLKALTTYCHAILNSAAFLYVD
jgi:hypothetical protein